MMEMFGVKFDCQIKKRFVKLDSSLQGYAVSNHQTSTVSGWIDFSMSSCKAFHMCLQSMLENDLLLVIIASVITDNTHNSTHSFRNFPVN